MADGVPGPGRGVGPFEGVGVYIVSLDHICFEPKVSTVFLSFGLFF